MYKLLKLIVFNRIRVIFIKHLKKLSYMNVSNLSHCYDLLNSSACDIIFWSIVYLAEQMVEFSDLHTSVFISVSYRKEHLCFECGDR